MAERSRPALSRKSMYPVLQQLRISRLIGGGATKPVSSRAEVSLWSPRHILGLSGRTASG